MYIHQEKKLAFLAHPRTGSRTLRDMCENAGFHKYVSHHAGPERVRAEITEGLTYFCMVRNHWDALVSWWHFQSGFLEEQFLSEQWLRKLVKSSPQYFKPPHMWWFLQEVPDVIVLRYEDYDNEVANLFKRFGLTFHKTPSVLDTKYKRLKEYRRYYDIGAEKVVQELFGEEVERLGYTWND